MKAVLQRYKLIKDKSVVRVSAGGGDVLWVAGNDKFLCNISCFFHFYFFLNWWGSKQQQQRWGRYSSLVTSASNWFLPAPTSHANGYSSNSVYSILITSITPNDIHLATMALIGPFFLSISQFRRMLRTSQGVRYINAVFTVKYQNSVKAALE